MSEIDDLRSAVEDLQSQLAFHEDTVQILNDALASQQQEILLLRRQLELLKELQDQQGRALDQLPDLPAADEKPPHY